MKKNIIYILIAISFLGLVFTFYMKNDKVKNDTEFSEETKSKIELIKEISSGNFYLPFEENNKQYILFGYQISSYSDLQKSSMKIKNITYRDVDLVISLEVKEIRKRISRRYMCR